MSRSYKNPPVLEALCEFKFQPDAKWDDAIPDLIHEKIKAQFPERLQENPPTTQFRPAGRESALLQVAPNLLAINQLKPYPTWRQFKQLILDAYVTYRELAHPTGIARLGLRYINQIEIPGAEVDIGRFLRGCPPSAHKLFLSTAFPFEAGRENLSLILAHVPHSEGEVSRFFLDLDYGIPAAPMALEEIDQRLERAHDRIEHVFEAMITDETRRLFGWEKKESHFPEIPQSGTPTRRDAKAVHEAQAQYGTSAAESASAAHEILPSTPMQSLAETSTAKINTTEIVAHYRAHLQELAAKIGEWQSAEAREAERWERLEMEMGVEKDIVFKEPEVPHRIIKAIVHNCGPAPVPPFFYDPVDE